MTNQSVFADVEAQEASLPTFRQAEEETTTYARTTFLLHKSPYGLRYSAVFYQQLLQEYIHSYNSFCAAATTTAAPLRLRFQCKIKNKGEQNEKYKVRLFVQGDVTKPDFWRARAFCGLVSYAMATAVAEQEVQSSSS